VDGPAPDADHPNLGDRQSCPQAAARLHLVCVDVVCPGLDVNRGKLAVIVGLQPRRNFSLVDCVAPPGNFRFVVTPLNRRD
jgi:hypothetical protein